MAYEGRRVPISVTGIHTLGRQSSSIAYATQGGVTRTENPVNYLSATNRIAEFMFPHLQDRGVRLVLPISHSMSLDDDRLLIHPPRGRHGDMDVVDAVIGYQMSQIGVIEAMANTYASRMGLVSISIFDIPKTKIALVGMDSRFDIVQRATKICSDLGLDVKFVATGALRLQEPQSIWNSHVPLYANIVMYENRTGLH